MAIGLWIQLSPAVATAWTASHPTRRSDGMGARRLRCNALFPCPCVTNARPRDEQDHSRIVGHADVACIGDRRRALWISRRPHRAQAGVDGEHPDLLCVFLRIGTGHQHRNAGRGAIRTRPGDGRRVEYWRDVGRGKLAHRASRQGNLDRTEFIGAGIRRGGAGCRPCIALLPLAGGVFRGNPACGHHLVDSAERGGIRDVAGTSCPAGSSRCGRKIPNSRKEREKWGTWEMVSNLRFYHGNFSAAPR